MDALYLSNTSRTNNLGKGLSRHELDLRILWVQFRSQPIRSAGSLAGTVADPGNLIKETIERKPILIFGQRAGLFPRRKREGAAAPEQGSLFTFS